MFEGNSQGFCWFWSGQGEKRAEFNTYVRGSPHLAAGMHSCWHFKLITHQWSLNYTINIILLHIHIMPAWFHHNNIPAIIWADVKNKSSNKCEIMKILITFQSVGWPCTVPLQRGKTTRNLCSGSYAAVLWPTRTSGEENSLILLKGWLNLLVFGCKASLLHYREEIAVSTISMKSFEWLRS